MNVQLQMWIELHHIDMNEYEFEYDYEYGC